MGMTKPDIHDFLLKRRTNLVFDDFNAYTSGGLWTTTKTSAGGESVAGGDGDGGLLTLTTGGTVNNEVAVWTTNKLFTPTNLKPILFETVINYTDADTNNAAILAGFVSTKTNPLVDTTFALMANFTGAVIFKKPGDTVWSVASSIGTNQKVTQTSTPCQSPGAGLNQVLEIQIMVLNSIMEVTFNIGLQGTGGGSTGGMINPGQNPALFPIGGDGTLPSRQIKHALSITSAAAMYAGVYAKTGTGGVSQTPAVDYIGVEYLARP